MTFLEQKPDVAMRFAERKESSTNPGVKSKRVSSHTSHTSSQALADPQQTSRWEQQKSVTCVIHSESKHSLSECRQFIKQTPDEKYNTRANHLCYRCACMSKHPRYKCKARGCKACHKDNHHLLCRQGQSELNSNDSNSNSSSPNP